jgi:hypothetical protein
VHVAGHGAEDKGVHGWGHPCVQLGAGSGKGWAWVGEEWMGNKGMKAGGEHWGGGVIDVCKCSRPIRRILLVEGFISFPQV